MTALPILSDKPPLDYELLLDCVHCGLCTATCPTYAETGDDNDSPRGRIYLMRSVVDGRLEVDDAVKRHLDGCLNCRACETACPSGVQYGKLIEPFRFHMEKKEPGRGLGRLKGWQRKMLFSVFPSRTRTRLALAPARLSQWLGLDWLLRKTGLLGLMPKSLRDMHGMLPSLRRHHGGLKEFYPAYGKRRAKVAVFVGCVADAIYPQTTTATIEVLRHNGCDVWVPKSQGCCGALHYHAAREDEALALARQNMKAFATSGPDWNGLDAIITNAAGCGAMLAEYPHAFHGKEGEAVAEAFTGKATDVTAFLAKLGPVTPKHAIPIRATYHDACHLRHAQQIDKAPRQLLGAIPGLELVPLPESELCCGAAGSYNLTQPEMADRLGARKAKQIDGTGATAVFMGNVGCLMQVTRHMRDADPDVWVAHTIDVLYAAYTGEFPRELRKLVRKK